MQSLMPDPKANYRNVVDALYRIGTQEGLQGATRGIRAVVCGAAPAHAMYFACYEKSKKLLSRKGHSNHLAHGKSLFDLPWIRNELLLFFLILDYAVCSYIISHANKVGCTVILRLLE